jgi:hypothetical protein
MEKLNFTNKETPNAFLTNIMTAEEYARIEHTTPYVFTLQSGDKELCYFGSPHVCDTKDPLFQEIENAFNKWNPDVVFVEGVHVQGDPAQFNEKIRSASREKVIEHMGESGFALKLALEKGVDWISPEPADVDLYNHLTTKGFSKEHIFTWNVFLALPQYNRLMNKEGFKQYVQGFIDRFKQSTNWNEFDYSYEHAIKIGEQTLNQSVDVENEPDALDFIDPIPWDNKKEKQTVLNQIGKESSLFRDTKILNDIANAFETHKRVFVVYGASHAVMQEPALRELFK